MRKLYATNKSGIQGVSWHELTGKWIANYSIDGKQRYIGSYFTKEEAGEARAAAIELLKEEESK